MSLVLRGRITAAVLVVSVLGAAPAAADEAAPVAQAVAAATPRCYGAASMAPTRCTNPALAGRMTPSPSRAHLDQVSTPGKRCYEGGTSRTTVSRGCTFGTRAQGRPHVILVGDSHARALMPAFISMAHQGRISLEVQVRAACSWVRSGLTHREKSRVEPCRTYRANLSRWLVAQAPRTDIIATTGFVRQISGSRATQITTMRDTWRPLISRGVRIVAISDNPRLSSDPQRCLKKHGARQGARKCGVSFRQGTVRDPFIEGAKAVKGAQPLDLRLFFCRKSFCPAVIGGVNVYRDITHVTRTYASTLTPYIAARML